MKKALTIIILVFLVILAGIGYFFYINNNKQGVDSGNIFSSVKNFFPFGSPSAQNSTSTTNQQTPQNPDQNTQTQVIEKFFQISQAPTAGYIAIDTLSTSTKLSFASSTIATSSKTGTASSSSTKQIDTFIRFIDRATGHIYESKIPTLEKSRISNVTTPKVYEAFFNSKGTEVVMRFLNGETISTIYNKINTDSGTSTVSIIYPYNTDTVVAKKDSLFYTIRGTEGSIGYLSSFDRKKTTQVFTNPLRDVLAVWSGGDIVAVSSKPHSDYPGVLFFVNTKTGTTKQVLSGINGLTVLPNNDATQILFNSDSKKLNLAVQKVSSNTTIPLGSRTLPEKCVWSKKKTTLLYCAIPNYIPENGYPEKWYQGITSFTDDIWSINTETGEENLVYSPLNSGKPAQDATNLTLNDKENYLFFINKKDLTLWGLSLE